MGRLVEADPVIAAALAEVLRYLVASGGNIIFAKSADTLFDLTKKGQMVFSFIIDLDELHSEVRFRLNQRELPGIRA